VTKQSLRHNVTVKLLSLLLSVGGIVGVVISLWAELTQFMQAGARPSVQTAIIGVFAFVFGLSTWIGVDLWKGKERAYKWAKILFAAQVPQISLPGFAYHFYSSLVLFLTYRRQTDSKVGLNFELGSAIALWVSPDIENVVLGVNLVALVALIRLIKAEPPGHPLPVA
jgi:hypothetical protein